MQVLAPLTDGSGSPGTVGQLLSSNGPVEAPLWQYVDGLAPNAAAELTANATAALGTSAFGRTVVCSSGLPPYTLTLPSPVGRAGHRICFRVRAGAYNTLVTLDAGAGVLIGKARTLGLWLLEAVVLVSDGANWFIESGWRRPMSARYYLTAALTATAGLDTAVPVSSRDYDVSGLMGYSAARPGGVQAPRAGLYQLVMKAMVQGVGGGGVANTMTLNVFVQKNAPSVSISTGVVAFMNTPIPQYQYGTATLAKRLQLAAGDYLHLGVMALGAAAECNPGTLGCYLELTEV